MEDKNKFTDRVIQERLGRLVGAKPAKVKELVKFHLDIGKEYRSQVANLRNAYLEFKKGSYTDKDKLDFLSKAMEASLQVNVDQLSLYCLATDFTIAMLENINSLLISYLEQVNKQAFDAGTFYDYLITRSVGAERIRPKEDTNE